MSWLKGIFGKKAEPEALPGQRTPQGLEERREFLQLEEPLEEPQQQPQQQPQEQKQQPQEQKQQPQQQLARQEPSEATSLARQPAAAEEDEEAEVVAARSYRFAPQHDGTQIRFTLLLGGPNGDNSFEPSKRTAICVHGVGETLEYWSDQVFLLEPRENGDRLPQDIAGYQRRTDRESVNKRAALVKELATRMNVVMLDLRGFGDSSRPVTQHCFNDTSVSGIAIYTCRNVRTATKAMARSVQVARTKQAMSYTVSISSRTMMVRFAFHTLQRFEEYVAAELLDPNRSGTLPSTAKLLKLKVMAAPEIIEQCKAGDALQGAGQFELMLLEKSDKASFMVDRMAKGSESSEVVVVHTLTAKVPRAEIQDLVMPQAVKLKEVDACLGFHLSFEALGSEAQHVKCETVGVFKSAKDAMSHIEDFQAWMSSERGLRSLEASMLQVHANYADVANMKNSLDVANCDYYQLFPLNVEMPTATLAGATMEEMVDDIQGVIDHLGAEPVTVIGHSLGAAIALAHAVAHPESVERLITIGGSSRTGKLAHDVWMKTAGNANGWLENVIRQLVAVVSVDEVALKGLSCPSLLINALDDTVTPVMGSQMLKQMLPYAELYTPAYGGHNVLIANDASLERLIRFTVAEPHMLFAQDPIFGERLYSMWDLSKDEALNAYYLLGKKVAEVELSERRERCIENWVAQVNRTEREFLRTVHRRENFVSEIQRMKDQVDAAHAEKEVQLQGEVETQQSIVEEVLECLDVHNFTKCLAPVVAEGFLNGDVTARELVLFAMYALVSEMSTHAQELVEEAGLWWKDTGRQSPGYTEGKYTVDAFGRRRGESQIHNCAWFRWEPGGGHDEHDPSRPGPASVASVDGDHMFFRCWWCGGHAAEHDLLGSASANEVPGSVGPGGGGSSTRGRVAAKSKAIAAGGAGGAAGSRKGTRGATSGSREDAAAALTNEGTSAPSRQGGAAIKHPYRRSNWRRTNWRQGAPFSRVDLSAVRKTQIAATESHMPFNKRMAAVAAAAPLGRMAAITAECKSQMPALNRAGSGKNIPVVGHAIVAG